MPLLCSSVHIRLHLRGDFSKRERVLFERLPDASTCTNICIQKFLANAAAGAAAAEARHFWKCICPQLETVCEEIGEGIAKRGSSQPDRGLGNIPQLETELRQRFICWRKAEFKVDLRIEGIAHDVIFKDERANGPDTRCSGKIAEKAHTRNLFGKIWGNEETLWSSARKPHHRWTGQHRAVRIRQLSSTIQCHSC